MIRCTRFRSSVIRKLKHEGEYMKKSIAQNGVTSQSQSLSGSKPASDQTSRSGVGRRSFLKGLGATGAVLLPASALLATKAKARNDDFGGEIGKGDASILRFLAAAEILESDLWEQYWELGGVQARELPACLLKIQRRQHIGHRSPCWPSFPHIAR